MGFLAKVGHSVAKFGNSLARWEQSDSDPFAEGGAWSSFWGGPGSATKPRDARRWIMAYRRNSRLRAAVSRVASDVAKATFHLCRDDDQGRPVILTDHPFLDFMRQPWRLGGGGSWVQLNKLNQIYIELVGEAFMLPRMVPGSNRPPSEVVPVPPHWVANLPCSSIPFYDLVMPFQEIPERVPEAEMIYRREHDPLNPFSRGLGVASSIDDEVNQEDWSTKYNSQFYKNAARPDMLVSVNAYGDGVRPDPASVKRLQEQWETRHQGFWNAFKVAFTSGDVKVNQMSSSHLDMQYLEGRKFLRDVIFQAWPLPPEIMGVIENSNRSTSDAALYLYSLNIILPRLIALTWDYNRLLVPLWDKKAYLAFESPVRETEEFKLSKSVELFKAGAITRNECRVPNGYDPLTDERGDEILQPSNTILVPISSGRYVERKVRKAA